MSIKKSLIALIIIALFFLGCSQKLQFLTPDNIVQTNECFEKVIDVVSKIGVNNILAGDERTYDSSDIITQIERFNDDMGTYLSFDFLKFSPCWLNDYGVKLPPTTESQIKFNTLLYIKWKSDAVAQKAMKNMGSELINTIPEEDFRSMSFDNIYQQAVQLLGVNHKTSKSVKLIRDYFSKGFVYK